MKRPSFRYGVSAGCALTVRVRSALVRIVVTGRALAGSYMRSIHSPATRRNRFAPTLRVSAFRKTGGFEVECGVPGVGVGAAVCPDGAALEGGTVEGDGVTDGGGVEFRPEDGVSPGEGCGL